MRTLLLPALLLAGCASAPSAPPPSEAPKPATPGLTALDGTTWKLSVEPLAADEKPYNDLIRFEDRHVSTAYLEKVRRFAPGSYSQHTPPDGVLTFEASLANPDGEAFSISGKANPGTIWGTMTWRRADWSQRTYRFKGTPKTP